MTIDRRDKIQRRNAEQDSEATKVIVGIRNGRLSDQRIFQLSGLLDEGLEPIAPLDSPQRVHTGKLTADLEGAYGMNLPRLIREFRTAAHIRAQS